MTLNLAAGIFFGDNKRNAVGSSDQKVNEGNDVIFDRQFVSLYLKMPRSNFRYTSRLFIIIGTYIGYFATDNSVRRDGSCDQKRPFAGFQIADLFIR